MSNPHPFSPIDADEFGQHGIADEGDWARISPVPRDAPRLSKDSIDRAAAPGFGFSKCYAYRDASGALLGYVVRFDRPANGSPAGKEFKPFTLWQAPDGELQWRRKSFAEPRPLYHLEELAKRPDTPVLVVEGEKAADAAQGLFADYVVTTSPGGSKAAGKADWTALARRDITIWADNDAPGAEYAEDVAKYAREAGAQSVHIVALPDGLPRGWDLADPVPDGISDAKLRALLPDAQQIPSSGGDDRKSPRSDGLPKRFELKSDGVYWRDDSGDEKPKWLCSPLKVVALTRDRAGEGWGRYVEVLDPDGRRHFWAIPARLLAGDGLELRSTLLDLGLQIASGRSARQALSDLLLQWRPRSRALTADRLGWADEQCAAFILGDGRVLGNQTIVYQHENAPAAAAEMKASGSLEGWRDAVAIQCVGNPLLIAGVSLAFAGPLLELLGLDGGGIHLRGASSRGKSTIQRVAVSVWGSPRFLHTWRATSNGLEGVASASNATLLALDEIGEVSGRDAGAAAYMLANGAGKSRANREGRARPSARWKTMILSSGEISLADKMAEGRVSEAAGQAVRLIDIIADSQTFGAFDELHGLPSPSEFADELKRATAADYGTAGPALVSALIEQGPSAAEAARKFILDFVSQAESQFDLAVEGQTVRVAQRLGAIAAAGEMATGLGFTGWPEGSATQAAMSVLELWLTGRGGAGAHEAKDAIKRIRAFILAHGASRFERFGDGDRDERSTIVNRAGWTDGDTYYFGQDAWREVHQGADATRAARYVADAGFLITDQNERHLTKRMPTAADRSRPRAYGVRAEIMGFSDEG